MEGLGTRPVQCQLCHSNPAAALRVQLAACGTSGGGEGGLRGGEKPLGYDASGVYDRRGGDDIKRWR